jgi:hypothetical protein
MNNAYDFIIAHSYLLIFAIFVVGICCKSKSQCAYLAVMLVASVAGPYGYWTAVDAMSGGVDMAAIAATLFHGSSIVRTEMILFLSIPFVALHEILSKD